MTYNDLHAHSTFSFLDGVNQPAEVAARAAELGRTAHALTDHGNVSVHPLWESAAKKAGIKPIFGVEAYFTPSVADDREVKRRVNTHLTVLAETEEGYRNLLAMVTEANRDGFYYRPLVDEGNLRRHSKGLIFLSGCLSGMMAQQFVSEAAAAREPEERVNRAIALTDYWKDMVGPENYFLETQFSNYGPAHTANVGIVEVARRSHTPLVITGDVHIISAAEQETRRLLHCIRDRRDWEAPAGFTYDDGYMLAEDELDGYARVSGLVDVFGNALSTIQQIVDRCNVTLPKSAFLTFPLPEGMTDKREYLLALLKEGAAYRGVAIEGAVRERLLYEITMIEDKGFIDYFLVVADMVLWAKTNGILVGPGRGSAAGSLACWLLRITEINPLEYGLMFERFIDVTRSDLPDIDLDFDQTRRDDVRHYLEVRYGADHVGILGTFIQWKGRNSLDAVAKVFHVPHAEVEIVKSLLIERAPADPRAHQTLEDTIAAFPRAEAVVKRWPALERAALLEGQMHGYSTHACGLLISAVPLNEVCATYYSNDGEGVCSVNGPEAETLGLLKIDVLALKTLSVFRDVLDATGMTDDEYYALPRDDEVVFEAFREQKVAGVFQFEGHAARDTMLRYVDMRRVLDLAHVNALARPGPLESGVEAMFLRRHAGIDPVELIHPIVDRILGMTHGLMVYQEQVLMVAHEVGQLGWADCNALRKAMTKKRGTAEFDRVRDDFLDGAERTGLTRDTEKYNEDTKRMERVPGQAEELWDSILTFGGYGFNLSHAVAYSVIGQNAMWFKQHHPTEFWAALCKYEGDKDDLRMYLTEFQREGGTLLPPHVNRSDVSWKAEGPLRMRAGLMSVEGIGDIVAEHIHANAPYESPEALATLRVPQPTAGNPNRVALVANARIMQRLQEAGAFSDEAEHGDYMGIGEMLRVLEVLHAPDKVGFISKERDGVVAIAGIIREIRFKSAAEGHEARSRVLNEATGQVEVVAQQPLKQPKKDTYVNITVGDDTGDILCQINRFSYAEKAFRKVIDKAHVGDVVVVEGDKSTGWRLVRVDTIEIAYRMIAGKYVPWEDVAAVESGEITL